MTKQSVRVAITALTISAGFASASLASAKVRRAPSSGTSVAAPVSFYCIAFPSTHSVRVPGLPAYGHGSPVAASQQAALDNCQSRSPFGAGANCRISACYPE